MSHRLPDSFGFYAILTNPVRGYDYLTRLLVDYEVAFIQLRMKERLEREVAATAELMRRITEGTAGRFIVNDYPRIAAAVGADGVHVGQGDMPYAQARSAVGPDAIVGISTHSPEQTSEACGLNPDYIGIGPVWATTTKKVPDSPIGIEGMQKMLSSATVPSVVLGSITTETLPEVLKAGARNFSLVRPLNESDEPEKVLREILHVYHDNVGA
ncbi:MAG: thiamine phosphate synthase [Chitinivibrionales bacterium]|nr:thiamine phosphate synthase [Chitinivibrionales bacterium]MBD3356931.1 thiamine phosphate synthase [Chitinivibrionales bacterium]